MKDSRWLSAKLVGQFEFVEWTSDNHLRHSSPCCTERGQKTQRTFAKNRDRGPLSPDIASLSSYSGASPNTPQPAMIGGWGETMGRMNQVTTDGGQIVNSSF